MYYSTVNQNKISCFSKQLRKQYCNRDQIITIFAIIRKCDFSILKYYIRQTHLHSPGKTVTADLPTFCSVTEMGSVLLMPINSGAAAASQLTSKMEQKFSVDA